MKHLITYLKTILDIGSEKIGSKLPILTIIWHFSKSANRTVIT